MGAEISTKLPPMPDGVVQAAFEAASSDPYSFVCQTIEQVSGSSPTLVMNRLEDAFRISYAEGPFSAMLYLRGSLFVTACFNRLTQEANIPPIYISRENIRTTDDTCLPDGQLFLRVKQYSPLLASHLRTLNGTSLMSMLDPQVVQATYDDGLQSFAYFERSSDPSKDLVIPTDLPNSAVLLIRQGFINQALVDLCLNPEESIRLIKEKIRYKSPDLERFVNPLPTGDLSPHLVGTLIIQGITQEYGARGLEIPWPTLSCIDMIPKDIDDGIQDFLDKIVNPEASYFTVVKNYNSQTAKENPYLLEGINLLKRLHPTEADMIDLALYRTYKALRNMAESKHWEDLYSLEIEEPVYEGPI